MAGDWRPGPGTDLADLLTPFAERLATLVPPVMRRLRVFADRRVPPDQENTLNGSRTNIAAHYDLSNELFAAFLDPTMSYSSAWFDDSEPIEAATRLEEAQLRKIDGILDLADVRRGHPRAGDRIGVGVAGHPRRATRCPCHGDHPFPRADAAGP